MKNATGKNQNYVEHLTRNTCLQAEISRLGYQFLTRGGLFFFTGIAALQTQKIAEQLSECLSGLKEGLQTIRFTGLPFVYPHPSRIPINRKTWFSLDNSLDNRRL